MAKQARVRPSWKKNTARSIKRSLELLRRLFNKRIGEIIDRNGTGSTASFEGHSREIKPNEYYLRVV
jgi:hypothetical protein